MLLLKKKIGHVPAELHIRPNRKALQTQSIKDLDSNRDGECIYSTSAYYANSADNVIIGVTKEHAFLRYLCSQTAVML